MLFAYVVMHTSMNRMANLVLKWQLMVSMVRIQLLHDIHPYKPQYVRNIDQNNLNCRYEHIAAVSKPDVF